MHTDTPDYTHPVYQWNHLCLVGNVKCWLVSFLACPAKSEHGCLFTMNNTMTKLTGNVKAFCALGWSFSLQTLNEVSRDALKKFTGLRDSGHKWKSSGWWNEGLEGWMNKEITITIYIYNYTDSAYCEADSSACRCELCEMWCLKRYFLPCYIKSKCAKSRE